MVCKLHGKPACLFCTRREPNLQNIPVNTETADLVRKSFIRHFPAFGQFDPAWLENTLIQGTVADTSILSHLYRERKEKIDGDEN